MAGRQISYVTPTDIIGVEWRRKVTVLLTITGIAAPLLISVIVEAEEEETKRSTYCSGEYHGTVVCHGLPWSTLVYEGTVLAPPVTSH